jgi:arginase
VPRVSLIGVPTDVGASRKGCRLGPAALRVAGIGTALRGFDCDVRDLGDLSGPPNPELPAVGGYRHLAEVISWNRAVHQATAGELADGRLPILLGGDHSIAIGSLSAVAAHCRAAGRRLRVLWLDAHADFNTAELTPSGNLHGMPVACLAGLGPDDLTGLSGTIPALRTEEIRQIGVRSVDQGEKELLTTLGVEVFDMRFVDEIGMRKTMTRALAGIGDDTHLHLSLDLDFIDPAVAPGVGTPVPGGATYREAQLCMEMIADTGLLGSMDLVELNPALDLRNTTAELAVDLLESLFGKSTLNRLHSSGVSG